MNDSHIDGLLDNLAEFGNNLKHLSLSAENSWELSRQIGVRAEDEIRQATRYTPELKELNLFHVDLYSLYDTLAKFIDLTALTHLALHACPGVEPFIAELGRRALRNRFCLEHIAVDTGSIPSEGAMAEHGDLNESFENIPKSCAPIRNLHLGHAILNPTPPAIMMHLRTRGSDFDLLSLHSDITLSRHDFESVCKLCPNLQQLAFRIDNEA
jgi:hypothetical protein